jgi:predicted NUDIX family NTP pyrophosphohydrolase
MNIDKNGIAEYEKWLADTRDTIERRSQDAESDRVKWLSMEEARAKLNESRRQRDIEAAKEESA